MNMVALDMVIARVESLLRDDDEVE
jgi:hypothetical protein